MLRYIRLDVSITIRPDRLIHGYMRLALKQYSMPVAYYGEWPRTGPHWIIIHTGQKNKQQNYFRHTKMKIFPNSVTILERKLPSW